MFRLRQTSTLSLFMAAAVSSAFIVTTTSSLPVFDEIYNTVFDQVQEEQRNADLLEADADYDRFFERLLDDTSFGCTADSCPGGDFCNFDDGCEDCPEFFRDCSDIGLPNLGEADCEDNCSFDKAAEDRYEQKGAEDRNKQKGGRAGSFEGRIGGSFEGRKRGPFGGKKGGKKGGFGYYGGKKGGYYEGNDDYFEDKGSNYYGSKKGDYYEGDDDKGYGGKKGRKGDKGKTVGNFRGRNGFRSSGVLPPDAASYTNNYRYAAIDAVSVNDKVETIQALFNGQENIP